MPKGNRDKRVRNCYYELARKLGASREWAKRIMDWDSRRYWDEVYRLSGNDRDKVWEQVRALQSVRGYTPGVPD